MENYFVPNSAPYSSWRSSCSGSPRDGPVASSEDGGGNYQLATSATAACVRGGNVSQETGEVVVDTTSPRGKKRGKSCHIQTSVTRSHAAN